MFDLALAAADPVHWGEFKWTGDFTMFDLIAATINAVNGALLARRPDHYKNFTVVGILLMALLGGMTGGIVRDVILNHIPAALTNPANITLSLAAGVVGASAAVAAGLPIFGALAMGVISAVAGRYLIDLTCGVPPKLFIRGEWFVVTTLLTAGVWLACDSARLSPWSCALIAVAVGFTFRLSALYRGWEEPLAKEPAGAYQHTDGRPLLGRKLAGKSVREMHDLGLSVDADN